MASIDARTTSDGTTTYRVRWRQDGKARALTFIDAASAEAFRRNVEKFGPTEAMRIIDLVDSGISQMTLEQWCTAHIETLTGVEEGTRRRYRAYVRNDLNKIGTMPLSAITDTTISRWVNDMDESGASGKTIANKHGFMAGALNHAVRAGKIAKNPCDHTRLPRTDAADDTVMLTRAEFDLIHDAMTPRWRPFTRWLVATGMRFGEATALVVSDVDARSGTVRISKAWKHTGNGERKLGHTKSRKGHRTINVPASVIDSLDLNRPGGELLFPTQSGGPISHQLFRNRAWLPALAKVCAEDAEPRLLKRPRPHDLRHTCASWMINNGVPMAVVQQHLGHESIQTTIATYTHIDRSSGEAAAEVIGKMLS
ncbi:MAG: site-specific integrase [Gordonia sp. (in: high G+C Gram-positive bacteria)]|uniref:tyrosine-type recombinase/integrase n=1 Tax=Gordonia sp. (in: high G+C Gram-positive bacteria) TaxID=84139 RepID=UPI003C73FF5F